MPRSVTLSLELLQTFVSLIRHEGEAAAALRELGLNQPTFSKRLRYLQHAGLLLDRPWVVRRGKTWHLTEEGRRVWPAVSELVDRYANLRAFVGGGEVGPPPVRFACGQQTAAGLVREALAAFRVRNPDARVRVSTLRGQTRIEGVSNGTLDLAVVTHDASTIHQVARRPLHVEPLVAHHSALVCAAGSQWERRVRALPKAGVPVEALAGFPLILPEPDAGYRRGLDAVLRRKGVLDKLDLALEVGGWATILVYVRDGFGVGVVSEGALDRATGFVVRRLDPGAVPPLEAKLICRTLPGSGEALDLSEAARSWRDVLVRAAGRAK
jgi:DNA-binding transcriptional LysR family regulator